MIPAGGRGFGWYYRRLRFDLASLRTRRDQTLAEPLRLGQDAERLEFAFRRIRFIHAAANANPTCHGCLVFRLANRLIVAALCDTF
jgi:hypothetical protein